MAYVWVRMKSIIFKKQMLGQWRRDDGESIKHVSEETMYKEIKKLVDDGWYVTPHGITINRSVEVTKD